MLCEEKEKNQFQNKFLKAFQLTRGKNMLKCISILKKFIYIRLIKLTELTENNFITFKYFVQCKSLWIFVKKNI